jgi:Putative MetA-pathway of phenol degradation
MLVATRLARLSLMMVIAGALSRAQQPFYTDDPGVTGPGKWHFEFFNEFDLLQHGLEPNLKQNTVNYRLNYGLSHNLELDIDNPYLTILRSTGTQPQKPHGVGDTNLGVKWNFHRESDGSKLPSMGVSMYFEFPTGDSRNQLGSGLTDYWLNGIVQKHLTERTRITGNAGILFAGNTSTGLLGIQTTRGGVFTGGVSVLHGYTKRLTLGIEANGGFAPNAGLAKSQLQFLGGGSYAIRNGFGLDFGVLGGKFLGSPRIGVQLGISVDFPAPER